MYLKKIDLSRVSDEAVREIFEEVSGHKDPILKIIRFDSKIKVAEIIEAKESDFMLEINCNGSVHYVYGNRFVGCNYNKAYHLLLETQWIRETEKVPEHGQKIVLKAKTCDDGFVIYNCELFAEPPREEDGGHPMIYYMAENNSDGIAYDLFDTEIIGWIDADNVVM